MASLRRQLQAMLSSRPRAYGNLLRALGRGSVEKRLCLSTISRGARVLDIGANEGYFTMLFSDIVGPNGFVHSFEPVPETFRRLSERVRLEACFDNIHLHAQAASSIAGEVVMQMPGTDSGQASLVRHEFGSWTETGKTSSWEAQAVCLDDHISTQKGVDFVKCDIEGAELLAFKGMSKTLRQYQPLLLMEVCPRWMKDFGYDPKELFQFLSSLGYTHFISLVDQPRWMEHPAEEFQGPLQDQSVNILCAGPRRVAAVAPLC